MSPRWIGWVSRVHKPHVVIVGGGFGGLAAVKALARAPVAVTLVDRQTYHLFQPLLYQVATTGLSPGDIAWPIRRLLRRQPNQLAKLIVDLSTQSVSERRAKPTETG